MSQRESKEQLLHKLLPQLREVRAALKRLLEAKQDVTRIFHAESASNSLVTLNGMIDWQMLLSEYENWSRTQDEVVLQAKLLLIDRMSREALDFIGRPKGEVMSLIAPYASSMVDAINQIEEANRVNALFTESRTHRAQA